MQVTAITHRRNAVFSSMISQVRRANRARCAEIWRGLQGAGADSGKVVIAVSEDVDPNNADAVFWWMAIAAIRSRTCTSCLTNRPAADLRPRARRARLDIERAGRRDAQGGDAAGRAAGEDRTWSAAAAIWQRLGNRYGLPRLALGPPWHGYGLGDWSDLWEDFVRKCAAGDWQANGANTDARRRPGVTPETPVT